MSSNLAVEEPMAADPAKNPGGDERREDIPPVKSSEEVGVRGSGETVVEEGTAAAVTGTELSSEDKSAGNLQGNDLVESKDAESGSVGDAAEEGNDPTAISLHDLTGGLDMDGKPTEVEMEEAVAEGSVENDADLVPSSTEVAAVGEAKDLLINSSDEQIEIGVPESEPAAAVQDEEKLEGGEKDETVEEGGEGASEKEKRLVDDEAATVGQPEEVAYENMSDKANMDEGFAVEENEEVGKATSDSCVQPMDVGVEQAVEIQEQVTEGEQRDDVVLDTHVQKAGAGAGAGADIEVSQYGERNTDKEEKPESSLEQDNIVQGITHVDGKEAVVYHRREKHSVVRNATLSPETHKEETIPGDIHVTYDLITSVEKDGFAIYDLVWGKVKSHPWWPGVIISPSDGSNLAMKFKKKDSFLVAYFGDKTFAWCDESQLKPFFPNFSHYEKQATTDAFSNAVKSVLVEVCRRFDVGMICSCLEGKRFAREIYPKLENAGVRQGFVNCAVDTHEIVKYFNPKGLVDFIKDLAVIPTNGTTNKLELVMTTSQVKSFYRMKGYVCPKFHTFGPLEEYVEPVIESSESEELPENSIIETETPPPTTTPPSVTKTMNNKNNPVELGVVAERNKKRRGRPPKKKKEEEVDIEVQKPLSLLVRKKMHSSSSNLSNGSQSNNSKPERVIITDEEEDFASPLPWKKRKEIVVEFDLVEHEEKNQVQAQPPRSGGGFGFKIGECISRAASRLTAPGSGSSPLITTPKFDSADFDVSSDDDEEETQQPTPAIHEEKRVRKKRLKKYQYSDPKDILLQLCIVATTGHTKENNNNNNNNSGLSTVISYFTDFRNFTVNPPPPSTETCYLPEKVKARRGRKRKVDLPVITPYDEIVTVTDHMQDSYWSDMILCGQTEEPSVGQKQRRRRVSIETKHQKLTPGGADEKRALALATAATKRPIIRVEEKRRDECNPTALLLCLGIKYDGAILSSEMDIVRIFSRYGPLKEWEMGKSEEGGGINRVWIVFKRRSDAETAFGNLRRENLFGQSLVSYRLVYELHEKSEQDMKVEAPNGGEEHFELKAAAEETVSLPTVTGGDDATTADLLRNVTGVDAHAMLVGAPINIEGSINVIRGDNVDNIAVDPSSNVESIDAGDDVCSLINPSNDVVMVDDAQDNHMDDINVDEMSIDPPPSTAQVEDVKDVSVSITPNTVNEVLMKGFGSIKDGSSVVVEPPTELSIPDEVIAVVMSTAASNTVPSQSCGDSDQPTAEEEEHDAVIEAPVDVLPPTEEGKDVDIIDIMPVETNINNTEGIEMAGEEEEEGEEVVGNTEQGKVAADDDVPVEKSSTGEDEAVYKISVEPTSTGQGEVVSEEASVEAIIVNVNQGEEEDAVELSVDPSSDVFGESPVEPSPVVEDCKVQNESDEIIQADEKPVEQSSPEEGEVVGDDESLEPCSTTEKGEVIGTVDTVEKDGKIAEGSVEHFT